MDKSIINFILICLIILSIGILSGYSIGYYRASNNHFPVIEKTAELNPGIATLQLEGEKNGKIIGKATGQKIRLVINPTDIREIEKGNSFEITTNQIPKYEPASEVPPNTRFIASKRGKYFYSILDPKSKEIVVKNRLYFETAELAEKAGFVKPTDSP